MKNQILHMFIVVALLALATTACASNSVEDASSAEPIGSESTTTQQNSAENGLPNAPQVRMDAISELALGTLLLEDSQVAVQPEQAAQLLPLWQVYKTLTGSETAAQAEIDAIQKQIEETMLPEQIAAIDDLEISSESMRELFEEMGMEFGFGGRIGAQGTPDAGTGEVPFQRGQGGDLPQGALPEGGGGGRQGFGGGQGGMPGGMAPEGMPEMPGQADPALQATRQAGMGSGQIVGVNPMVLNALIELLQGKVQTSG